MSRNTRTALSWKTARLDVDYHEYPMGHQVAMEEAEVVKGFLGKVLRT